MATFAKASFSAASYAAFRPVYPPALYHRVLDFHRGAKRLCLDLGCGTGIVTREMGTRFDRVIGTDPSPGMITQAQQALAEDRPFVDVSYRQGSAEHSPFLEAGSVDCIVAGQAAHWFDYARLWPEMARLLRPGGTLAFWGYKDPAFIDYPAATHAWNATCYGEDPDTALGPYWQMPGRRYVQELLRVVQPPQTEFEDVQRVEYEPACEGPRSGQGTLFMEKSLSVREAKDYFRTASSFHAWQDVHPEQKARAKGGPGDLVDHTFDAMAERDAVFGEEEKEVQMEWGSALVMARRR